MRVCIIQPKYSTDYSKSDEYFAAELAYLDQCDETMDIIVLPESADIPCLAKTKADAEASVKKYNARLIEKCRETAKRCSSIRIIRLNTASRPWKYRPAGPAIVKHDLLMPYPRICAHRGFSSALPENSMPAFGAAVAMGAEEMLYIIKRVEHDNLGVCYDSNHFIGSDNAGFVRAVGKYILTTHISDYDGVWERHWFPGRGVIDWKEITKTLDDVGYTGPILFETGFAGGEPDSENVKALVSEWKKAIE